MKEKIKNEGKDTFPVKVPGVSKRHRSLKEK